MEVIRKKICFDRYLSHRDGLMPYYEKDKDDSNIVFVEQGSENGNYGNFTCDFAVLNSETVIDEITGLYTFRITELSRLKYCDIIRKYNEYKNVLKNYVIVKKAFYDDTEINYIDCINDEIYSNTIVRVKWTPKHTDGITFENFINGNGVFNPDIQDYNILDANYLTIDTNGCYYLDEYFINERIRIQEKIDNGEEISDDELSLYNSVGHIIDVNTNANANFCIIVDNYDFVLKCGIWWDEWWSIWWPTTIYSGNYNSWENYVFNFYYSKPYNFKFLYDVEKYLLGRIHVPSEFNGEKIDGVKVPEVITTLNYNSYRDWFDLNEENVYNDSELLKEWNKRGGDAFYEFLKSLTFNYLQYLTEPSGKDGVYIVYSPSKIDVSILLEDTFMYESQYVPYEYSVDFSGNVVENVSEYVVPEEGAGSALTPTFQYFEENEITCESKLNNLLSDNTFWVSDEISGVFSEFSNQCQLFRCTYYSGTSSNPLIVRKKKTKTYAYEYLNGILTHIPSEDTETDFEFDCDYEDEILPLVTSNCYQVVGIKKIGVELDNVLMTNVTYPTVEYDYLNGDVSYPLHKYTYQYYETVNQYSWWECDTIPYSTWSSYTVADGEYIDDPTLKKYKNVLIISCAPYLANDETVGNGYYFMAKYNNGNINRHANEPIDTICTIIPLDIPYIIDYPMNVMSYDGEYSGTVIYDVVTSKNVDYDRGIIEINYTIGQTSGYTGESGIHYKETYLYEENIFETTIIDGIYYAEIYYNKLFINNRTNVYSEDFRLEREANIATITGMEIGTQWTSASCVNAYLITEETTDGIIETPQTDVSISFDRGAAAAWESHFKMSECNTLEDLENYGNGSFFNV